MILVTGGTGLVGSHILLHTLKKGLSVRATYRPDSNLERVKKVFGYYLPKTEVETLFERLDWVKADINDIPALELAFQGVTQVIHAAALISFDPTQRKRLKKVNIEGTANIVNLCIAHNIQKLGYLSSIATLSKTKNGESITEDIDDFDTDTNDYALSKYEAELEVWRGSQEGLAVVIANPGVVLGPGFWEAGSGKLFTTANKGYPYYPTGGTGFITVNDVAKIMVRLMDSNIQNERFIAVGQNSSYRKVLNNLTLALGKPIPKKALPLWMLEVGRRWDWLTHLFTGRGRKLTKHGIRSLSSTDEYDNEKLRNALDFEFESLDRTLRFSCSKFMEENP